MAVCLGLRQLPKGILPCHRLILNGFPPIDLSPSIRMPAKPITPPGKPQAGNDPAPQNGDRGTNGSPGGAGAQGKDMNFSAQTLTSPGALWIRIDGGPGGPGGDGGAGGKGSSGPQTCTSNPDGGGGGNGGAGGQGGPGGDTAAVK